MDSDSTSAADTAIIAVKPLASCDSIKPAGPPAGFCLPRIARELLTNRCYLHPVNPIESPLQSQLDKYLRHTPRLGAGVYLARGAVVLGDVEIGESSSVWYNAVVRGDINRILIGHHSNVQDNAVLHLADDFPCLVGNWVTIGHSAVVHACTIGDESLIGIGAVVLDGAVIGRQCLIGAKSVVTPGTEIPDGSMVLGTPGKVVRALSDEERGHLKHWAEKYVQNAAYCLKHHINVGAPLPS